MNEIDQVRPVLEAWRASDTLVSLVPLTPDASTRRYYRATFAANEPKTVVAVFYDSVASPEYEGVVQVNADRAYVELTRLLASHGVRVPEIYLDTGDSGVVVLEDLGDRLLADIAADSSESSSDTAFPFFESALEQLVRMQSIPSDSEFFAFQRSFSAKAYYNEMREFLDFLLSKKNPKEKEVAAIEHSMKALAEHLQSLPKVLTHRDFHGWNLLIDARDRLRVIDFQDALMAPRTYDLVGLLNDRDMDSLLGRERYTALVHAFREMCGAQAEFFHEYDRVLLQRDLKVSGRFAKLTEKGLPRYQEWIPGTLRRIGRTLSRLSDEGESAFAETTTIIRGYFPEIDKGLLEERWY